MIDRDEKGATDPSATWKEKSLRAGGFGSVHERRSAWLRLLDLSYLEAILDDERHGDASGDDEETKGSPTLSAQIPLDDEGWQITSHHVDDAALLDSNRTGKASQSTISNEDEDDDGWSVASSKRKKRTRGMQKRHEATSVDHSSAARRSASSSWSDDGFGASTSASQSRGASTESASESLAHALDGAEAGEDDTELAKDEQRSGQSAKGGRKRRKKKQSEKAHPIEASSTHAQGTLLGQGAAVKHKDEEQVALDVQRSFIHLGDTPLRAVRREELSRVIIGVLRRFPLLHYYQGYHDVISVLLSVMVPRRESDVGKVTDSTLEAVVILSSRLSLHFLRDAMSENMTPTIGHLKVLRNMIRNRTQDDPSLLFKRVEQASPLPYFALPWLLSMFAHEVDFPRACLVFDYLLARGPASLLHLCCALIECNKNRLDSRAEPSSQGTKEAELDPAEMHQTLSRLPQYISEHTLPEILRVADDVAVSEGKSETTATDGVMAELSTLFTWNSLPRTQDTALRNDSQGQMEHEHETEWAAADERANIVLRQGVSRIVLDTLPSPPISEHGGKEMTFTSDDLIDGDKALVSRRWWKGVATKADLRKSRKRQERQSRSGAIVAWIGAVSALSAALIIMYGTHGGSYSSASSGIGSAFPVGFRAADTVKVLLRGTLRH